MLELARATFYKLGPFAAMVHLLAPHLKPRLYKNRLIYKARFTFHSTCIVQRYNTSSTVIIIKKTVDPSLDPSSPSLTYFFWKYVDTFTILDTSTFFSVSTPRDAFDFALRFLPSPSSSTADRDLADGAPASATAISLAFSALMCVSSGVKLRRTFESQSVSEGINERMRRPARTRISRAMQSTN